LTSDNMFLEHEVPVSLAGDNELVICFRSLDKALAARRPRPRWKTKLVAHQQLRWFRTTLLGRIPGWSPPVAPVGPWRPVELLDAPTPEIDLRAEDGVVTVRAPLPDPDAELVVGETRAPLAGEASIRVPGAELWWPHTHGAQPRYPVSIRAGGRTLDLGQVAFRTVEAGPIDGDFRVRVNGAPIFCRGACWTPVDDPRPSLQLLRDAGMNMVRVGGTMVYEDDAFYDLCDELGILVWQDFMFANMDYPTDEPFVAGVRREARQLCRRLQGRPSLAVLCGNSEIEQQVAMLGLRHERGPLFGEVLPEVARELVPDVPYVPSSPC